MLTTNNFNILIELWRLCMSNKYFEKEGYFNGEEMLWIYLQAYIEWRHVFNVRNVSQEFFLRVIGYTKLATGYIGVLGE